MARPDQRIRVDAMVMGSIRFGFGQLRAANVKYWYAQHVIGSYP